MSEVLAKAEKYLREEVAPRANEIDGDVDALREALQGLCERDLMALRRPEEYGGPALAEQEFRAFQEAVARYSGALAFLQTQHQSAVGMIVKSENDELKSAYLPQMGDGRALMGIGFSQLRRGGPPMLRAEECDGGYTIDGDIPWMTGLGLFHELLIGAELPSGEAVFGIVPFASAEDGRGKIEYTEPMRLAAMDSAQTVQARVSNWHIPDSKVAFVRPRGWIANNDMINITLQAAFALGCARAGLDVVLAAYEKRQKSFVQDAWTALDSELDDCRAKIVAMHTGEDLEATTGQKLKLRAWAIELAARCAHAGVVASSGAASSIRHPAQRVYREALVYSVSAQTGPIMEATLARLSRRSDA